MNDPSTRPINLSAGVNEPSIQPVGVERSPRLWEAPLSEDQRGVLVRRQTMGYATWVFALGALSALLLGCGDSDSSSARAGGGSGGKSGSAGSSGTGGFGSGSGGTSASAGAAGAAGAAGVAGSGGFGGSSGAAGSGGGFGGVAGAGGTAGAGSGPASSSYRLAMSNSDVRAVGTSVGGLLLATRPPFGSPVTVTEIDASGKVLWSSALSAGSTFFGVLRVQRRPNGGYVLGGWTGGAGFAVVVTLSSTGQLEWAKAYAALDDVYVIAPTSDGGYLFQGSSSSGATVVRADSQGNVKWASELTLTATTTTFTGTATSDGGYALIGMPQVTEGLAVAKIDSQGKEIYLKSITTPSIHPGAGTAVALASGGVMAALSGGGGSTQHALFVSVDAAGSVTASHHYPNFGIPRVIEPKPGGGFVVAGPRPMFSEQGYWWGSLDATGSISGVRAVGDSASFLLNTPVGLAARSDGSLLIAEARSNNNNADFAIVDAISASGSACVPTTSLTPVKQAISSTVTSGGGSLKPVTVTAATFPLTQASTSTTFPSVCGS